MMEGCVFISSKYRVTKGFKFHARPQTGAYSCFIWGSRGPEFNDDHRRGSGFANI